MNWPLLQNSLLLAGSTTALAMGFGLVSALWLATLEARWRNVFLALAIVALALPPFLVTNCWISLLGETGVLHTWLPFRIYTLGGTIWILALLLWPITLFAALAAWRRLEAAQLECEPAMTGFALLRWLLIPVAKGELALAAVLTFVLALNNFAVPAILQIKVLPDEMWVRFNTQFDTVGAMNLSLPLVIAPVLLLAWVARRGVRWSRVQGSFPARVFCRQLGGGWRAGCGVVAVVVCMMSVVVPLAQIVAAKRTWAELAGAVEASMGTIWNSFWFATLAATLVVGVAMLIHRRGASAQSRLTSAAIMLSWLSLFIPGVLIGIALIKIFNRPVLVVFYQSAGIVLLALVIRYFALAWTAVQHAVSSVDKDLTDAATLEGASRWQMFRFVVWPQIAPQLCAAWYVVYLLSLWDVESIVLVQPPGGETLALRIFNLLHYGHAAQVNALCLVLVGVAVLPLFVGAMLVSIRQLILNPGSRADGRAVAITGTLAVAGILAGCSPPDSRSEASLRSKFFERAIVIGSRGVGIGEFNKPRSLACDTNGNVYVVDMTGRVQKFAPDGKFLLTWQMPETVLGKAKGMSRDVDGNIIVVEPHYQRVNHFTPEGKLVAQWGCRGTNEGCFLLPRSVAQNSRGEILIPEYTMAERVQRFELLRLAAGKPQRAPHETRGAFEGGETNWPYAKTDASLSAEAQRMAWAAASGCEAKLLQVIGRRTEPGEFNRAEGICVDAQDHIYVADSCNHRIQVFSANGKFLREFGRAGAGLGQLSYPYDVKVDKAGNIFVCEFGNSRIQIFDANCRPVEIIGGPGVDPGAFNNPWGIAFDSHENLYVADALNHRVQKLVRRKGVVSGQWSAAEPPAPTASIASPQMTAN